MKRCTKCRRLLSLDCFHKNKTRKSGLAEQCRNCCSRRQREYHIREKKRINQQNREYTLKLKVEVLGHYAGGPPKCACCGDSHVEFLGIDHVDGGGVKHRKKIGVSGGPSFYRWLRKNNYPSGYRVLCQNCNSAFGLFGYCPHESNKNLKRRSLNNDYKESFKEKSRS